LKNYFCQRLNANRFDNIELQSAPKGHSFFKVNNLLENGKYT